MSSHGQLVTVLEGKWFDHTNVSVRDFLRPLMDLWTHGHRKQGDAAIHYEMFTTEASFRSAMGHAFRHGRPKVIYIAAHGDPEGIVGYHGEEVLSRTKIRNSIPDGEDDGTTPRGLLFGACSFVNEDNAEFLLKSRRVSWIAGYSKKVDWYDSSLLEAFFLKNILFPEADETPIELVRLVTARIQRDMQGLAEQLGFCVMIRKPGGGYINLMSKKDIEDQAA